jgi:hypothetical protein
MTSILASPAVRPDARTGDMRARCSAAKAAFTTRRVDPAAIVGLLDDRSPSAGDIVLATVTSLGHHDYLQLASGRRSRMHEGDEILVCYGNRYATHQWEAVVPPSLANCELAASGGVAGAVLSRHFSSRRATTLTPVGLAANAAGEPVNLRDHALPQITGLPSAMVPMITVVGTTMNAGKTTTACAAIRGLASTGRRVAGIKLTGTGACGDYFQLCDSGAAWVADFTDAGFVSTYRVPADQLRAIFTTLVAHAVAAGVDAIVAEIADGIAQAETAALIASPECRAATRAVLLAATDALGAQAAVRRLHELGMAPRAISGLASGSTLTANETRAATGLPVLGPADLARGVGIAEYLAG